MAEIISLTATVLFSWITFELTKNNFTTALMATWAGNIGYFGTILIQDVQFANKALRGKGKVYSLETFYQNVRALFIEFGIAEIFDTFLIRPALLYYFPLLIGNRTLGVVIAKFAADVSFYIPTIISYELSKNKLRNFK